MHPGVEIAKKAVRIAIWTCCALFLVLFSYVLIHRPASASGVVLLLTHMDTFLAAIGFFMCVIAAFIVDLWYKARFG